MRMAHTYIISPDAELHTNYEQQRSIRLNSYIILRGNKQQSSSWNEIFGHDGQNPLTMSAKSIETSTRFVLIMFVVKMQ